MKLRGSFSPPGDKSLSHRIALLSLLAEGQCRVLNYSPAVDPQTTMEIAGNLGVSISPEGGAILIRGAGGRLPAAMEIQCANSGTTMRLLMGILAGRPGAFLLDGDASLRNRPMERVAHPLREMGAAVECTRGRPPVRLRGGSLRGIRYTLPVASAQLKSALLLAGIQAEGRTTVLEPMPSRNHTEMLLLQCGARIQVSEGVLEVDRSVPVLPETYHVPGDISSAAFILCGAVLLPGSEVAAEGVLLNPTRTGFLKVLSRMGARIGTETEGEKPEPWGTIRAEYSPELKGCEIRAEEIPSLVDEVPILALAATQALGPSIFRGVAELRFKESDRLSAISTQLGKMGAHIHARGDDLHIEGPTPLRPPPSLNAFGDHRIAMTLRIAGFLADAEPEIEGEESTRISYPGFQDHLRSLAR